MAGNLILLIMLSPLHRYMKGYYTLYIHHGKSHFSQISTYLDYYSVQCAAVSYIDGKGINVGNR